MRTERSDHCRGHRERLRGRFRKAGVEGLQDYEIIELLLTYAISRRDVKPVAKELICRFGGLSGVLDRDVRELEEIPGVGRESATLLHLVKETCGAYLAEKLVGKEVLTSPQAVVDFARMKLSGHPHEAFMVIYLNAKNEALEHEILHEGTVDRSAVYPRRILEETLARRASGLVLIHNHPSGHAEPSLEDRRITRAIVDAVQTVDIRVVDHVIVGREGYFSFREHGLIGENSC